MAIQIKELKIEDVETNDLYLTSADNKKVVPTFVKSVDKLEGEFSFYGDFTAGVDTIDTPSGILIKRSGDGLELLVSKKVLEAIKEILPIRKRGY